MMEPSSSSSSSFSPFGKLLPRLIEKKNVEIYHYTYNRQTHFEQFKFYATCFVGYFKLWEPIDNLKIRVQLQWVIFISEILKKYNHPHEGTASIDNSLSSLKSFRECKLETIPTVIEKFRQLTPRRLMENILGLKYIDLEPIRNHYKNVWGPRYWLFLHYTSFCINQYGKELINSMADLMLNLHMVIVCPECYENIFEHDIVDKVTMSMRETQDPITVIYNFHNVVNASIGNKHFSQNSFYTKYECEMKLNNKIDYSRIIYI